MKRLFTFLFLFVSLNLSAQHLSFKGVPIDGNITEFVSKMKAQGYVTHELNGQVGNNTYILKGQFAGMSDCTILILYSTLTKTVCKVVVSSDDYTSWSSVKNQYTTLSEAFSKKYTQTTDFCEFVSPYYEGDGYEFLALDSGKGMCASLYEAEGGTIVLEITAVNSRKGYVKIVYEDKANFSMYKSEKDNDIIKDI